MPAEEVRPFAKILARIPPEQQISRIERNPHQDKIREVPMGKAITGIENPVHLPQDSYGKIESVWGR